MPRPRKNPLPDFVTKPVTIGDFWLYKGKTIAKIDGTDYLVESWMHEDEDRRPTIDQVKAKIEALQPDERVFVTLKHQQEIYGF